MAIDNAASIEIVSRARELVHTIPPASETALCAAESNLRARIVTLTHEIMYLLQARDLFVIEHESLLANIENRQIDLTI